MSDKNQIIDSLCNVSKWTPYIKYIYRSLSEIANEFFNNIAGYEHDSYKTLDKQERVEGIVQMLAVRLIFDKMWDGKKIELFDEKDLQLIKGEIVDKKHIKNTKQLYTAKIKFFCEENLKLTTDKSTIEQINDLIRNVLKFGSDPIRIYIHDNETVSDEEKRSYLLKCYAHMISFIREKGECSELGKAVTAYIKNICPKDDNERREFLNNVYLVLIQFMCLNDQNRCYQKKIDRLLFVPADVMKRTRKTFNERIISALKLKDTDYKIFVQNIVKNYDLRSFALGQDDYDVRNYPDSRLFDAIKDAMSTQEQKDEFQQFLKGETQIPNCEKEYPNDIYK